MLRIAKGNLVGSLIGLSVAAILIGCGGSAGGGISQTGAAQFSVDWSTSKAIGAPQSVTFTLTNPGTQKAYQQILNRAPNQAQQSAVFKGLPVGNYTLQAVASDATNGQGNEVSQIATSLQVTQGNMSTTALAMSGAIKAIVIPNPPTTVVAGDSLSLTGFATDSQGRGIFLPPNELQWTVKPNSFGATITPTGVLVTSAAGTISVDLTDVQTSQGATVTLTLTTPVGGTSGGNTGGTAGTSSTGATTGVTTGTTGSSTTTTGTTGSTTTTTGSSTTGTSTTGTTTTGSTTGATTGTSTTGTSTTGATTGVTSGTTTGSSTTGLTAGTSSTGATSGVTSGTTGA